MKSYLLPALFFLMILSGCKKDNLTPDGKPKADAANNTLRVDLNSTLPYDYIVEVENSDYSVVERVNSNSETKAYEYVATVKPGQRVAVEVNSGEGSKLTYNLYYKGAKVRLSAMDITVRDELTGVPSQVILSYIVDK